MNKWKSAGIGWALVTLLALLGGCSPGGSPREPIDLTILHTGQVIGETAPCG